MRYRFNIFPYTMPVCFPRIICKAQAEAGLDPICNVGHYNKASLNMFRDLGFRTAFNAMYLEYKPPTAPSAPSD